MLRNWCNQIPHPALKTKRGKKLNTKIDSSKSRLVPQGSTSVQYTYTMWHSSPPHWNSSSNFWQSKNVWKEDSRRFNAHLGYLPWGAKCNRRRKISSVLIWPRIEPATLHINVQNSTARQHKCAIYLCPVTFSSSSLKFVLEFLGVRESLEMRFTEVKCKFGSPLSRRH